MKQISAAVCALAWGKAPRTLGLMLFISLLALATGCGGAGNQARVEDPAPNNVEAHSNPGAPAGQTPSVHNPAAPAGQPPSEYVLGEGDLLEFIYIRKPSPAQAEYRLQVGDVIKLTFPYYPELNTEIAVPPQGSIYLPKIGPQKVINLTLEELRSKLKAEFSQYLTQPEVVVNLSSFYSGVKEFFASLSNGERGYTREVIVRSDGKISLPLIGDIEAEGLMSTALQEIVQTNYSKRMPEVSVTLSVRQEVSKKVLVLGEVNKAGIFQLTNRLTPLEAVALAGGHSERANLGKVVIIRKTKDHKPLTMVVNANQSLGSGPSAEDIYLKPYDVVYVPKTAIATLNTALLEVYRLLPPFASVGFGYTLNPAGW